MDIPNIIPLLRDITEVRSIIGQTFAKFHGPHICTLSDFMPNHSVRGGQWSVSSFLYPATLESYSKDDAYSWLECCEIS